MVVDIEILYQLVDSNPDIKLLIAELVKSETYYSKINIVDVAKSFFFSLLNTRLKCPILLISRSTESANKLYFELQNWLSQYDNLYLLPDKSIAERANRKFGLDDLSTKIKLLTLLGNYDAHANSMPPLIVASPWASCSKLISLKEFNRSACFIEVSMIANPTDIVEKWSQMGYESDDMVELPGTFCRRGGILDIFPLNTGQPVRLEFTGNKIDSIRKFDPRTQKSTAKIDSVFIAVASDIPLFGESESILNYLPDESLLILDNEKAITDTLNEFASLSTNNTGQEDIIDVSDRNDYCLTTQQFEKEIDKIKKKMDVDFLNNEKDDGSFVYPSIFTAIPKYGGKLDSFLRDLKAKFEAGYQVIVISQQIERLQELLIVENNVACIDAEIDSFSGKGKVIFIKGSVAEGWSIKENIIVYTDNEIFGFIKQQRTQRKRPVKHHLYLEQLHVGDYVVHIDHGIGRFIGFTQFDTEGNRNEYIVIEYAASDKLYVPISQIDRVSRYVGGNEQKPSLSRLNTKEWSQVKGRIKRAIKNIAKDLLNLYATRQMIPGFAFSTDSIWQRELESSFPYEETVDQMEALMHVKADMEMARPMDRIICGDVGYGKTEIALRAAFKAVMDNKQVAILVPTTVLVQQHYLTFIGRLGAFPVNVKVLSRFCSDKEQKEIIGGLASGNVDICIGTHRLLQKDIVFKDLGLLVIDEEQRFGVVHKEYFKKMRQEIDILTLTATPIPRTLHMSLSGIKDLSVLETPPEDRLPIKTMLSSYNFTMIEEAILNEVKRGGQVFYVHNRIYDIYSVANKLREVIPNIKIEVAHGRMAEEELERIMLNFVSHDTDVLLTTTIIESGIDIPNANTLIVDDSDKFGLVQLYQLRGRIGRGSNNAYSYLFFNPDRRLTDVARKRLTTITEATELGAGFTIAMKDLEIRGAGNILGTEQSGYIAAIGFDLYSRLLAEAVEELKNNDNQVVKIESVYQEQPETTVSLGLNAYIPEEFISGVDTRIEFYKRVAYSKTEQDLEIIKDELEDRFGPIPEQLSNLLYFVSIKRLSQDKNIDFINKLDNKIVIAFKDSKFLKGKRIANIIEKRSDVIKRGTQQITIDLNRTIGRWQEVLLEIVKDMNYAGADF